MRDKIYNFFKYSGEFALYGLLFFLPISNALIETFFGIALFSFIVRKTIKPDFSSFKFWPNFILFLFFIFIGLSLLNSGEYFQKSLWAWFAKWGQYLGICFIVQDTIWDKKILKRIAIVFLASAALVVASGFTQHLFGIEFLRGRGVMHIGDKFRAITSSFSHYNSLGVYMVVVIPLLVSLFIYALKKKNSIAYLLGLFLFFSFTADILTFSRGSWAGLTFFFIFLLLLSRDWADRRIVIFIVASFGIYFVSISYFAQYISSQSVHSITAFLPTERLFFTFQPGGDSDRFKYWHVAFKMIQENPYFGKGVGTFMDYFSKYLPGVKVSYAHNCYLQIFAETGVFSLASFLFYIITILFLGVKSFLAKNDYIILGILGGCFAYLVHAFFDTSLYSLPLAFLFWMWVGCLAALIRLNRG